MRLRLDYGTRQRFRARTADITIRGMIEDARYPLRSATFSLNDSPDRPLYVEQVPDEGVDWTTGYKDTPAELRCRHQGELCVEFAGNDKEIRAGGNRVSIAVVDAGNERVGVDIDFDWDPTPAQFPIDLRDLSGYASAQEIGQAVNGVFDVDRAANVIRSRAPVAPDALFLVGAPSGSQEATYGIRFLDTKAAKWLGCSDFFAGMTEGRPPRGIRVGWSSAGMAALSPADGARSFIAWGDHSADEREWAIATHPAVPVAVRAHTLYRVRHRISMHQGEHRVRWRIWPADTDEPTAWLCDEDTAKLPSHLPRHPSATFGLFQHFGLPIEWSDILVRRVNDEPDDLPGRAPSASREPFLGRSRPGAF